MPNVSRRARCSAAPSAAKTARKSTRTGANRTLFDPSVPPSKWHSHSAEHVALRSYRGKDSGFPAHPAPTRMPWIPAKFRGQGLFATAALPANTLVAAMQNAVVFKLTRETDASLMKYLATTRMPHDATLSRNYGRATYTAVDDSDNWTAKGAGQTALYDRAVQLRYSRTPAWYRINHSRQMPGKQGHYSGPNCTFAFGRHDPSSGAWLPLSAVSSADRASYGTVKQWLQARRKKRAHSGPFAVFFYTKKPVGRNEELTFCYSASSEGTETWDQAQRRWFAQKRRSTQ
jgi:hypothetical protein